MGTFSVAVQLESPDRSRWEWIETLVDTGASYSWMPVSFLRELGIEPTTKFPFILADGSRIERDMAEATVRWADIERTTLVIFGDEGTQPLLGAYTLEGLGVAADPVNRRLVPMTGFLL